MGRPKRYATAADRQAAYSASIETMLGKLTAQFHARATALTPVPPTPVIS